MSSPFPVICLWKKERRVGGGDAWLRVVSKEREWNKKSEKNGCQVQQHRSILPALNRGRRAWMWSGWKDLEEEERHRKVLLLEPLSLPLHFAHCQAHYFISLAALHYDRILSELKANLQKHAASENCDEKTPNQKISVQKYGQRYCWLLDIIG